MKMPVCSKCGETFIPDIREVDWPQEAFYPTRVMSYVYKTCPDCRFKDEDELCGVEELNFEH